MAWVRPNSHTANGWASPENAYDGDTGTSASYGVSGTSWSPYLEMYLSAAIECSEIRVYTSRQNSSVATVEFDIRQNSTWTNVYSGEPTDEGEAVTVVIDPTETVDAIRVRFYADHGGGTRTAYIHDTELYAEGEEDSSVDVDDSDTGSGADFLDALAALLGRQDVGSGVDEYESSVTASLNDSGSGVDTVSGVDTGEEMEATHTFHPFLFGEAMFSEEPDEDDEKDVNLFDTGSGVSGVVVMMSLSDDDTGAGAEVITHITTLTQTDTGSGVETVSVTQFAGVNDTGSAAEAKSIETVSTVSDSGILTDSVTTLQEKDVDEPDSGSGVDITALAVTASATDTGTGADTTATSQVIGVLGTATSQESLISVTTLTRVDSGVGSSNDQLAVVVAVGDSGISGEDFSIDHLIEIDDSGSTSHTMGAVATTQVSDTGSLTDSVDVISPVGLFDTGLLLDSVSVAYADTAIEVDDTGSGVETMTGVGAELTVGDSGALTDNISVYKGDPMHLVSDAGAGVDGILIQVEINYHEDTKDVAFFGGMFGERIFSDFAQPETVTINVRALIDRGVYVEHSDIIGIFLVEDSAQGQHSVSSSRLVALTESGAFVDLLHDIPSSIKVSDNIYHLESVKITPDMMILEDYGSAYEWVDGGFWQKTSKSFTVWERKPAEDGPWVQVERETADWGRK